MCRPALQPVVSIHLFLVYGQKGLWDLTVCIGIPELGGGVSYLAVGGRLGWQGTDSGYQPTAQFVSGFALELKEGKSPRGAPGVMESLWPPAAHWSQTLPKGLD